MPRRIRILIKEQAKEETQPVGRFADLLYNAEAKYFNQVMRYYEAFGCGEAAKKSKYLSYSEIIDFRHIDVDELYNMSDDLQKGKKVYLHQDPALTACLKKKIIQVTTKEYTLQPGEDTSPHVQEFFADHYEAVKKAGLLSNLDSLSTNWQKDLVDDYKKIRGMAPVIEWAWPVYRKGGYVAKVATRRKGYTESQRIREELSLPLMKVIDETGSGMNGAIMGIFLPDNWERVAAGLVHAGSTWLRTKIVPGERPWGLSLFISILAKAVEKFQSDCFRTLNKLSKFKALKFMMDDKAERHINRMFKIMKKISKSGARGITKQNALILQSEFKTLAQIARSKEKNLSWFFVMMEDMTAALVPLIEAANN